MGQREVLAVHDFSVLSWVKLILSISNNCVLMVINASVGVTLLEHRLENIQALSGS